MLIDSHAHATGLALYNLYNGRYPTSQSALDLAQKAERSGVDFVICFPISTSFYFSPQALALGKFESGGPERFPYQFINRMHLRECSLFGGGRLMPFLAIDPVNEICEQANFVRDWADCIFGLKFHTRATNCSATALRGSPFLDLARAHGLPIMIHTNPRPDFTHARHVVDVARDHPDIRFCIAHAADFDWGVLESVREYENLYVDTSPFLSLCADYSNRSAEERVGLVGDDLFDKPDHVLSELFAILPKQLIWGTDEPWTAISGPDGKCLSAFSYADEVRLVRSGSEEFQRQAGFANSSRFLLGRDVAQMDFRAAAEQRLQLLAERVARSWGD